MLAVRVMVLVVRVRVVVVSDVSVVRMMVCGV